MMFANEPEKQEVGYIIALGELTRADINRAGGKAANLGELVQAGFRVPDGFVVTTEAFGCFLAVNNLSLDSPPQNAPAQMPGVVAEALRAALHNYEDVPMAVRSSAIAEDLADASFAGQYETVLDVCGESSVIAAVIRCWTSAFNRRVATYRRAQNVAIGNMAVLVQCLVHTEAAGVAFTANPVTGDRAETVVSAVRGLGERLVSGQVSPDEWVVRGQKAECHRMTEKAIDAEQAREIAGVTRRIESHFHVPQDVEWAFASGELFILQARPITALPEPSTPTLTVSVDIPSGFWQRDASHYPRPFSPTARSILIPITNAAFGALFEEFGSMLSANELREIGGWAYRGAVLLGSEGKSVTNDSIRKGIELCVTSIREDKAGHVLGLWYKQWQPELAKRISELKEKALDEFSDAELDVHLSKVIDLFSEGSRVHYMLTIAYAYVLYELMVVCRDLLGWNEGQTFQLVNGVSTKSTEPSRQLAELAHMAKNRPSVLDFLERLDSSETTETATKTLDEIDAEFAAAFATYMNEYGICALSLDVAESTLLEKPQVVLGLIRDQIRQAYDPENDKERLKEQRRATRAEALETLQSRTPADLDRFQRVLERAERAYAIREDRELYTFSVPLALIRFASLEVGRRLAEREAIARPEDVFFMEIGEMRETLRTNRDQQALVIHRLRERAWVEAHPGPEVYGEKPETQQNYDSLPPEVKFAASAVSWIIENVRPMAKSTPSQTKGSTISGIPAAPGQYTGPVRVVADESEFSKIRAGDVLVCTSTSPVWSVLFPSIGALVTDVGGILSHPAIIAREYCVPAVVATENATKLLHDGQIVTVDGNTGVVEVASDSSSET